MWEGVRTLVVHVLSDKLGHHWYRIDNIGPTLVVKLCSMHAPTLGQHWVVRRRHWANIGFDCVEGYSHRRSISADRHLLGPPWVFPWQYGAARTSKRRFTHAATLGQHWVVRWRRWPNVVPRIDDV